MWVIELCRFAQQIINRLLWPRQEVLRLKLFLGYHNQWMLSIHVELIIILSLTIQNKFIAKNTEYFYFFILKQATLKKSLPFNKSRWFRCLQKDWFFNIAVSNLNFVINFHIHIIIHAIILKIYALNTLVKNLITEFRFKNLANIWFFQ